MASTETRTGFRLPWVSDAHPTSDATPDAGQDVETPELEGAGAATEAATDAADDPGMDVETGEPQLAAASRPAPAVATRRPTKFLADLTRAMRSAAEAEREEILGRFRTDAKAFTETIHERSAVEAAELRATADADISGIRDWSKAEIARIREETEHRIGERHTLLDHEVEAHAARIERRIEHVQGTVEAFEAEMSRFFEALLAEEDPTRFAELAANLPEPPSLEAVAGEEVDLSEPVAEAAPAETEAAPTETEAPLAGTRETTVEAASEASDASAAEPEAMAVAAEPEAPATTEDAPAEAETIASEATALQAEPAEAEVASETTGPGETAELAEPSVDDGQGASFETPTASEAAPAGPVFDEDGLTVDPRVAALGLTPDFGAAEAEAARLADDLPDDGSGEAIPAFDEETIAARLAGLVPAGAPEPTDLVETRITVTGLVSVASIAGFKRGLARMPGIQSVSVSSGPDGEFIFSVSRSASMDVASAIATMPGFSARVTGATDDGLEVTAHDPDAA